MHINTFVPLLFAACGMEIKMKIEFNNFSFTAIVVIIFGGIIVASVYAYYSKMFLGGLIRKLNEKKIMSDEDAVILKDLGYGRIKMFFLQMSLSDSSSLRNYVKTKYTTEEAELLKEKNKGDQMYYLDSEKTETALARYDAKNMKLWKLIVGIVVCSAAAILCAIVFPYIISMMGGK